MPVIKSAKKRARQEVIRRDRNAVVRRRVKDNKKALIGAKISGDKKKIEQASRDFQSVLDIAVKKNIMHKNKAARLLSRTLKSPTKTVKTQKSPAKKQAKTTPAPTKS